MTDDRPLLVTQIASQQGVHPDTVKRWIKEGLLVSGRRRVFLAYSMRGVKYVVKPSDLAKFFEEAQLVQK